MGIAATHRRQQYRHKGRETHKDAIRLSVIYCKPNKLNKNTQNQKATNEKKFFDMNIDIWTCIS